MIVVDSVGWIEYVSGGPAEQDYAAYIEHRDDVITPTIVVHEVYKRMLRDGTTQEALVVIAKMLETDVVDLSVLMAVAAAEYGLRYKLPMADSIIYATAQSVGAQVVTSDKHFKDLPDVVFIPKPDND